MVKKICPKCGESYSSFWSSNCLNPVCIGVIKSNGDLLSENNNASIPVHSHNVNIAVKSAKIVNVYGTFLQVVGIIFGVLIIICGFFIARTSSSFLIAIGGIILGLLDIAIFAVQGALLRMISNYVIARLGS